MNKGHIHSIRGSVIEAIFEDVLPNINNKLVTGANKDVILEVAAYVDTKTIKAIALTSTEGLSRGDLVVDTQNPIMVPVGIETLGRCLMFLAMS